MTSERNEERAQLEDELLREEELGEGGDDEVIGVRSVSKTFRQRGSEVPA